MARGNKKQRDETEQLKSDNKELKSTVKSLMRHIKKLEKEIGLKQEHNQDELIKEELDTKKQKCPSCTRGNLKLTPLGPHRTIRSCSICDYKMILKVNQDNGPEKA